MAILRLEKFVNTLAELDSFLLKIEKQKPQTPKKWSRNTEYDIQTAQEFRTALRMMRQQRKKVLFCYTSIPEVTVGNRTLSFGYIEKATKLLEVIYEGKL